MGRRLFLLLALVAFAAPPLLLRAQQQPSTSTQAGTLRGVVTRQGTTEPLRDVTIIVARGSGLATTASALELALNNIVARDGAVADALRQELLNSAALQAGRGGGTNSTFNTVTDSNGQFVIEGVPAGEYSVVAQREGFFGAAVNGNAPTIVRTSATITSQQTSQVEIAMIPGGAVNGRVVGPTGMPVPNVSVEVFRLSYQNGARTLQSVNQKQTDDRGEYRLYQLAPGEYYLAVNPRSTAGAAAPAPSIQARTFYPGATDPANALPITVRPGDELTGLDLAIQALVGARISGRIVSQLPTPGAIPDVSASFIAGRGNVATLTLLARNQSGFLDSQQTASTSVSLVAPNNGAFELPSVPAGSYDVYAAVADPSGYGPAAPPGQAVQPVVYGRASVEVRGDVRGVTVVVHQGVDVKGQIVVDGKPAAAGVRVSLQSADSSASIPVYNFVGRTQVPIQPDGSFLIPSVPEAHYRLQPTVLAAGAVATLNVTIARGRGAPATTGPPIPPPPALPASAYIADVRQGGVSVYDDGIYINTSPVSPLEVLVNTNGGAIQGTVVGPRQQPVTAGTMVVLMPPVNRRQNFALIRAATTNAHGAFTMNGLPPGPYKLFAWESIPTGAYQNADFMKTYEERGVSVLVQEGATIAQAVPLIAVAPR